MRHILATMRIQLASDLHLEHLATHFPGERLVTAAPDADVLVLAGDISNGAAAVRMFADWPVPVIYVAGNHEAFDGNLESVIRELETEAKGTSVQFLERQTLHIGDVRFLGCTLWTDYCLYGADAESLQNSLANCDRLLMDRHVITTGAGLPFTAEYALREHLSTRQWLEGELNLPFDGHTVVVSHHAPHPKSINSKYLDNPANPGFVSDLSPLLRKASIWLHGHCHDNSDYIAEGCRVVANPRGYARNRKDAGAVGKLIFENPHFLGACVINVEEI